MEKPVILIVDDEPEIARYISAVAAGMEIATETAVSGKEFMERFAAVKPAGIVMDLVIPDMDGIELVQWLGTQGCTAPVVVISGFNPEFADALAEIAEAHGIKISGRLTKPFDIDTLEKTLSSLVSDASG